MGRFGRWVRAALEVGMTGMQNIGMTDRRGTAAMARQRALAVAVATLEDLNRKTEEQFLEISDKLAGFMGEAGRIASLLRELTKIASGEETRHASEALLLALDVSKAMEASNTKRKGSLETMRNAAGKLRHTLNEFDGTAMVFQTLGILTRIETTRLCGNAENMSQLPDDVKKMAKTVQVRVATALENAVRLVEPIETVAAEITERQASQSRELPEMIARTRSSLESFQQMRDQAREASTRLGVQYGEINGAFNALIVSVQFHDLTRQQIEHVIESLRRLEGAPEPAEWVVIGLQSAQLTHAGNSFAASVLAIADSLETVAKRVLEMAGEGQVLAGLSAGQTQTYLAQLEAGCQELLGGFGECAEGERLTRRASGVLVDTIGQMRSSVEEVEAVEAQMQMLAINACIQAAQLGEAGNALSALATFMQRSANEARVRSHSLVEVLTGMSHLSRQLGADEEINLENGCLQRLGEAVRELHATSERTTRQIGQVAGQGAVLSENVSGTRDRFRVGPLFAERIGSAQHLLEEAGQDAETGGRSSGELETLAVRVAAFATGYTMQSERDVYGAFVERVLGVRVAQPEETVAVGAGMDIEFF